MMDDALYVGVSWTRTSYIFWVTRKSDTCVARRLLPARFLDNARVSVECETIHYYYCTDRFLASW